MSVFSKLCLVAMSSSVLLLSGCQHFTQP
ncbi:MAG: outer membrane lipoprotein LolB, partial [Acinetobacter sp.]